MPINYRGNNLDIRISNDNAKVDYNLRRYSDQHGGIGGEFEVCINNPPTVRF